MNEFLTIKNLFLYTIRNIRKSENIVVDGLLMKFLLQRSVDNIGHGKFHAIVL